MHSPRRMPAGSIFINNRLKAIDETEENSLSDSYTQSTKNKSIEYTRLRQCYIESQQLIVTLTTDKLLLTKQLMALRKDISAKQNNFHKILQYVRSELKHDRTNYQNRIKQLEQQVSMLRRQSTSLKPLDSALTTTEDYSNTLLPLVDEQQNNLARGSTSVLLWQFEEIFTKYFNQDHSLKIILQPLLRKMAQMPRTDDICQIWQNTLQGISHYERQVRENMAEQLNQFYQNVQGIMNISEGSDSSIAEQRESVGDQNTVLAAQSMSS